MIFKILDGREKFYQWDIDRKIVVDDNSITQVHFCNKTSDCSLVCEVREENGLRVADVPNILLQEDWSIYVYAYDKYYTKFSERFEVIKRSKPDSYVYTETEILCYQDIMERLDMIDANLGKAVEDYLTENPVEVDLSAYATKEEIPNKVSELDNDAGYLTQHQDLSAYAKKTDIPTKVSAFTNDAGYLTKHQDLTAYAKKTDVPTKVSQLTNDKGYLTQHQDLSAYAKKTDVPTKVSQLTNDANYLTEHQDLTDYAKKADIPTNVSAFTNDAGYLTEHQDLSEYAKKTDVPSIEGLATEEYVDNAIANIDIPEAGEEVDLSNYYTKGEVDALIPTVPDVSGFITMADVEAKGYQTAAQVSTAITTALSAIGVAEEGAY